MTPHRLCRAALQRTRKRSQRDPQDFYHGLLDPGAQTRFRCEFTGETMSVLAGLRTVLRMIKFG